MTADEEAQHLFVEGWAIVLSANVRAIVDAILIEATERLVDSPTYNHLVPFHLDCALRDDGTESITELRPLNDWTIENGTTEIIVGSHKQRTHFASDALRKAPGIETVHAVMTVGQSLLFWAQRTWHRGGLLVRRPDRVRHGLQLLYEGRRRELARR